ncbi:MAG: toxin-antitoxin system YwqK family antitoxin, partial [Syntrophothermus sp.]
MPKIKLFYFIFLALTFIFLCSCSKTIKEYWPDGTLKSEIQQKNGKYDGLAVWYNEDGSKQLECHYKKDQLEGDLIRFFPGGKPREQTTYHKGKKNGMSYTYY